MEVLELIITYDKESKELSIRDGIYSNYTYECDSILEIGDIVKEFIKEYKKGV